MTVFIRNMCRLLQLSARFQNTTVVSCSYKKCCNMLNKSSVISSGHNYRKLHDFNDDEAVDEETEPFTLYEESPAFVRNVLYPDSKDPVINNLLNSTSIQEVLDILKTNKSPLNNQQLTQAVVTFWDLIKVLHYFSGIPETKENVMSNKTVLQLHNNTEFVTLLNTIEKNVNSFNTADLSLIHLYLSKLGLKENHQTMKIIVNEIKPKLVEEFSLASTSRFVVTCYSEYSLRSHFNVQHLIPLIFKEIDTCQSPDEVRLLSVCLSTAYAFLTDETLSKYKSKINTLIDNSVLRPEDFKVILKILTLLNFYGHRDKNIELIRKCSVLIKRTISEMTASDVYLLYEIFHVNQETAEILNDIHRNATKHFLQMEEESNTNIILRLKLLSVLISLASPHQRHHYYDTVVKYVQENVHPEGLFVLRKILSDIKTSDRNLSNRIWDQIRLFVAKHHDRNLLKLVSEYSNFNIDIANYRHIKFENILTLLLDKELNQGIFSLLPSVLAHISLFYIPYSHSRNKIEKIVNALCENGNKLNSIDWLKISKAMQIAREVTKNKAFDPNDFSKLKRACDAYVSSNIGRFDLLSVTMLLKSYILRGESNNRLVDYLLIAASVKKEMSSILLKNMVYCFRNIGSYSPDALNRMADYICENHNNLLGSTIEKYLYFCYFARHHPSDAKKFFQVVIDVLIRDTQRMNGLTYLQASVALCYFNRLPQSFIKHIFNVSFLEKIDAELASCYAKGLSEQSETSFVLLRTHQSDVALKCKPDLSECSLQLHLVEKLLETYPYRVRHLMMELNRAVCLDHPEANVPWFHEKYIEERRAFHSHNSSSDRVFHLQVYESLLEIVGNANLIKKSFDSPYGYFIDFMITLNKRNEIVDPNNGSISTQFAIILLKARAFLRFGHLIGKYELKRRHLEILGYKVIYISIKDWLLLGSNKDKAEYVKSMIWPDNREKYAAASDR